jgi:hypothetical protein
MRDRGRVSADRRDHHRRYAGLVRVVDPFTTHGAIDIRGVHSDINA